MVNYMILLLGWAAGYALFSNGTRAYRQGSILGVLIFLGIAWVLY